MQSDNSLWEPAVIIETVEGMRAIIPFAIRILVSLSSNKITLNKKKFPLVGAAVLCHQSSLFLW